MAMTHRSTAHHDPHKHRHTHTHSRVSALSSLVDASVYTMHQRKERSRTHVCAWLCVEGASAFSLMP